MIGIGEDQRRGMFDPLCVGLPRRAKEVGLYQHRRLIVRRSCKEVGDERRTRREQETYSKQRHSKEGNNQDNEAAVAPFLSLFRQECRAKKGVLSGRLREGISALGWPDARGNGPRTSNGIIPHWNLLRGFPLASRGR